MHQGYVWDLEVPRRIGDAKVYIVGGWVRDKFMGCPSQDKDFLVVGGTHELMIEHGYKQVGLDFPVYLHPESGDEYALARTERKTGPGYGGFSTDSSPTITVEEDLMRRDLTINAMALDLETGELIDPCGGRHDMNRTFLRHTSDAFMEDPVRILRTARFAARYNFNVHKTTNDFMRGMVLAGAMNELEPHRVWAEMSRGLMERNPRQLFQVLDDCEALRAMEHPWVGGVYASGIWMTGYPLSPLTLPQRFALISEHFSPEDLKKARIPTDCARLSTILHEWKHSVPLYDQATSDTKLRMLAGVGAIGKDRATDLFPRFISTFLAWGDTRFDQFRIPQIDRMQTHANHINLLVPPADLPVKRIPEWMLTSKREIVRG
jgi:tRNA nucleotidyltransferase/poly(A) polymerase